MKAALRRQYCMPQDLKVENVEKPAVSENDLLIKVHATTVNRTDCANLTAQPFIMRFVLGLFKPREALIGTDFSGEVVEVGAKVSHFKVGDHVFGFSDMGLKSQAEYLVLPEDGNLLIKPEDINHKQAAASLEGAHYAYTFEHKVEIQTGQRVLINGATGAIGSALLQFVRQYKVHITATCNTKNIDLIQSLGADKIIDYTQEDFTQLDEKFDYVFDAVGKSSYLASRRLLKKKGVYISSEFGPYGQNFFYSLLSFLPRNKKVIFPVPFHPKKTMPYIKNLLEQGIFKPVIDCEYPLAQASEAYQYVISGQKTGNVILQIA